MYDSSLFILEDVVGTFNVLQTKALVYLALTDHPWTVPMDP
jgi:hypothetical protein